MAVRASPCPAETPACRRSTPLRDEPRPTGLNRQTRSALRARLVSGNLPIVTTVTETADPWTALGDPTRRAVFELVIERPRSVGSIAEELPVSRPAVSQHLRILSDAHLVTAERVGRQRIYAGRLDGLQELRSELERFWRRTLENLKEVAEREHSDEGAEHG